MKASTKKLITNSKGEVSKNISGMLANCIFSSKSNKIYTGYYSGSGRFTSAHSAITTVEVILNSEKFKYTFANDAPRGGIKGEYVKCSKIAFELLLNIRNSYYN